jgi:hypothetical protein
MNTTSYVYIFMVVRFVCKTYPIKINAREINKSLVTQLFILETKNALPWLQELVMELNLVNPTSSHHASARLILICLLFHVFLARNFACISHVHYAYYTASYK